MIKREDFVAQLLAGAVLLLLTAFVLTAGWSNWAKASVIVGVVVLIVAVVVLVPRVRRAWSTRQRRSRAAQAPVPPTLAELLDETWFVSFTSGPYVAGPQQREQFATAIAAVDRVDGETVSLRWRDQGTFPASVPIKLLEATQLFRFRGDGENRRRVKVRNEGLHSPAPGGVITGSGWRAHPTSPHTIAFARYKDLSEADKMTMEMDADLTTYDLTPD